LDGVAQIKPESRAAGCLSISVEPRATRLENSLASGDFKNGKPVPAVGYMEDTRLARQMRVNGGAVNPSAIESIIT